MVVHCMIIIYLKTTNLLLVHMISLNSIANVDEKYYLQIFSEEFEYVAKKKKRLNFINEELNLDESDDDHDDDDDDEENNKN